ncbi:MULTISPECIES: response regulator [Methanobacterium]|jgi:PAS domain S-box-containing protein|uniref:Histidine kinase n=1 Tax=Methanobacterium subterraneum TaxID=59277 RepID=A0A2H4VSE3_9EURY|nr:MULTISPECIES: response regulator [Methanobacterium]MBW4256393.1 response regulator [Methanobacterium sp. YSL]AUB57814.1 histidine kinase [Methanobacterium sp. MZ-A1]AUB60940.1 histidine kinase [Methanobacterium subterraneum]MCC7560754.1 response regulator [Methanobacterium sp.]NMO10375.1 response regulator [Methanobacterium subterraneum]
MASATILVVEDERITAEDIRAGLKFAGYKVPAVCSTGEDAVQQAGRLEPDLVLMDIKLEGEMDGIEAAAEIKKSHDIPVIYLTAYSDEETVERAKLTEPSGFLVKGQGLLSKPFDENELHAAIEITLYRHQMEKEHDQISSTMLMKTSEAVIATNSTGQIKFINNLAEEITGWRKDDALGKDLHEVFLPISEINDESSLEDALAAGELPEIISRNGARFRIKGTVTPIKDYKHQISGMVVSFQLHND